MTIFDYIDKYGDLSFLEKDITEVDAAIFSFLSYINFNNYLKGKDKITIHEIASLIKTTRNKIIAENDAIKIIKYMKNKKRYKDVYLYNYRYIHNINTQFSAITIEYKKNNIYISFKGTDELISGWIEDILLSYIYPTTSHKEAVKYINQYMLKPYKIILGGHSKGGNTAMVSGINSNFIMKRKIKKIYSMDGPGILKEVISSYKYKEIENKYEHFIPENSIVGILLENNKNSIIKSTKKSILSHDILYWEIIEDKFVRGNLKNYSAKLKTNINNYIYKKDNKEIEKLVKDIISVCQKTNIKTIIEFQDKSKIIEFIKEVNKLDKSSKKSIKEVVKIFLKTLGDEVSNRTKAMIHHFDREREKNEIK